MDTQDSQPPTLEDFAKYIMPRRKWSLVLGGVFALASFFALLGFAWGIYLFFTPEPLRFEFVIFLLALFTLFVRLHKKYRQNQFDMLSKERRAPILYLRPFSDEIKLAANYIEEETVDVSIGLALKGVGPLISVGKPGDRIPPLGAIRLYFSNEEWQEKVESLMSISQFVILNPAYSEGVEWEMAAALRRVPPEKLIFCFLLWHKLRGELRQIEYDIFRMQMEKIFWVDLPEKFGNAYFMYFEAGWVSRFATPGRFKKYLFKVYTVPAFLWTLLFRWGKRDGPHLFNILQLSPRLLGALPIPSLFRAPSATSVREALRPVMRQRGIKLPVWKTFVYLMATPVVLAVLIGVGYTQMQAWRMHLHAWRNIVITAENREQILQNVRLEEKEKVPKKISEEETKQRNIELRNAISVIVHSENSHKEPCGQAEDCWALPISCTNNTPKNIKAFNGVMFIQDPESVRPLKVYLSLGETIRAGKTKAITIKIEHTEGNVSVFRRFLNKRGGLKFTWRTDVILFTDKTSLSSDNF